MFYNIDYRRLVILLLNYTTTALEDWITQRYSRIHIKTAIDIDIKRIARYYDIYIHYKPMPARYDIFGRYRAIVLDARVSKEEQREQFFHELCHILRHVGHQSMLPDAFRELQEWDANRFTVYAALPYFILKRYDFNNPHLIHDLANDFNVTEELCKKRLEQIKRNVIVNSTLVSEVKEIYN